MANCLTRYRWCVVVFAWAGLCLCGVPPAGAQSEALVRAAGLLSAGSFEGARIAFETVSQQDALCAVAVAGQGAARLLAGEPEPAARLFADALVLDPGLPCAHLGAGTAACMIGDYQGGMRSYHSALVSGAYRPALPLAGEAHAACALGLYETAIQQARASLGTDPGQPLARHALAAASLARGDGGPAAALEAGALTGAPLSSVFLASCLLSPSTAYWRGHSMQDQTRLARLRHGRGAAIAPGRSQEPGGAVADFELVRPRPGEELYDRITVDVRAAAELDISYVVVRVNDSFAGISSARPFKVVVDTRLCADGPAQVRVDGHDAVGNAIRTASAPVKVRNGNRTLAPTEKQARAAVAQLLEELLLPAVSPVAVRQLAAHGLIEMGHAELAAAVFEGAYACDAQQPGLRSDLLLAYSRIGLPYHTRAPEVYTFSGNGKKVAVTFDDGPHPLITPWILDELDRQDVKATFFLVGKQVTLYPGLVREIKRRGHAIGSHSYAHYSLRHLARDAREQDLVKSRLAIREACGETVRLFRPPGGYYDSLAGQVAGELGFTTVFWTANVTSFPGQEGARIASELARQCADGGIILLHNGEDETLDTLPHLLSELKERGVSFVTVRPGDATEPASGLHAGRVR